MKPRLTRPLLAVAVAGALFAAGAVAAGPASAAPAVGVTAASETPGTDPTPTPTPSETGAPDPTAPTPGQTETTGPVDTTSPAQTQSPPPPLPDDPDPEDDPTPDPTITVTPPPVADTTAPAGGFKLTSSALWIGQRTSLTQVGVSDNGVADPASVTRVVTWGDGTSSTLSRGQGPIAKQYTRAGRFLITLNLTDAAGNTSAKSWPVTVTVPGKVKLSKSAVWHNERFNVVFSSVPAGTTRIVLNYGDGYSYVLKGKNQTVPSVYYHKRTGGLMPAGPVTLKVMYTNRLGNTSAFSAGTITIKRDVASPRVSITKPKKAERVSSWKTVRGTATDVGSGVQAVFVAPMRVSGTKLYCYTAKKTWLRITNDSQFGRCGLYVGVSKGKWSLALKGLSKGTLSIAAISIDWSDRSSGVAQVTKKLTR